ncbi:hypothetical protein UFOVP257_456 [uncultured Caudovirales phage]|uniref:Uncharacterized protein n=1 Tax=uncultured Caudovirales phage TaxID=2100421 RepID=A0A6J5LGM2_9CAUD|nr:hypothetical protein UFOVP257_456 [uncultured Caudovirales phage]
MAIQVNIPGVGNIEVQGAAEENTMRELLRVMQSTNTKNRRFDTDLANSFKSIDKNADDATSSMNAMASSARMASSSSSALYNELQNQLTKSGSAVGELGSYATTFGHDLLSTSSMISKEWMKNFNGSSLSDPVAVAAGTINAGLALAGDGVGLFGSGIQSVTKMLGPLGTMFGAATKDAGRLAAGVLTTVNDGLAKELGTSIRVMHDFATMGGNFANSLDEIRAMSTTAHLNLDQFGKTVKNNREQLMGLGQNMQLSALRFATFTGYMDTGISDYQKNEGVNRTYRQELRALGYDTEAQGDVMASYLQVLRSTMTQQQFNNVQARQVAEGVRDYAGNLKILAEFTGKDAKALQEKARAESMRGALLAKLDGKQQKAFMDSAAALNVFPEEVRGNIQNALMQQLSGGTITDPVIAGNARALAFVQDLAEKVNAGGSDLTKYTIQQAGVLRDQTIEYQKASGGIESLNTLFGAGGLVANFGKFNDALGAMKPIDPKEVEASIEAMRKQRDAVGETTRGYLEATQKAQDFANFLSNMATKLLPTYSGLIGDTVKITTSAIELTLRKLAGENVGQREVGDLVREVKNSGKRMSESLSRIPERADGDIVNGRQLSFVGEAGPEAIIPLKNGKTIPVEFGSKSSNVDPSSLVSASKAANKQTETDKMVEQLPSAVTTAMESMLNGPTGFASVMTDFKNQVASDNRDQIAVLQDQVDKLNSLVTAMQDNTRSSERIAYSMT